MMSPPDPYSLNGSGRPTSPKSIVCALVFVSAIFALRRAQAVTAAAEVALDRRLEIIFARRSVLPSRCYGGEGSSHSRFAYRFNGM